MSNQSRNIADRFETNLRRIEGLVSAFRVSAQGRGRSSVVEIDILRAAVVLLHASLEDLLRSTEEWRLPFCKDTVFAEWPIVLRRQSRGEKSKITLADLLEYKGQTVDDVLRASIGAYLERLNYNSVDEVARVLGRLELDTSCLPSHAANLEALMRRRHWIAHRADRNRSSGRGHYAGQHLTPETVETWLYTVRGFGQAVLSQLHSL